MEENKMQPTESARENLPAERDIAVITKEINDICRQAQATALMYAVEIGRRLCEAKSLLPYGQWGTWLSDEVKFSQSSANNFMRLFNEYGSAQISIFGASVDSQTLGKLPYSKALQLLAIPSDERETFAEEVDAENISTRELAAAIKEKEEAKREAEELRAKLRAAEEADGEMKKKATDYDEVKKDLDFAVSERDKAIEKAKKLSADLDKAKKNATVPKAELDKIKAEAETAAKKAADESAAKKIEALNEKLRDAEAAKIKAELDAKVAREDAERAEKALKTASPALTEFKTLFDQMQATAAKCRAALEKMRESDPETAEKCEKALKALAEKL